MAHVSKSVETPHCAMGRICPQCDYDEHIQGNSPPRLRSDSHFSSMNKALFKDSASVFG